MYPKWAYHEQFSCSQAASDGSLETEGHHHLHHHHHLVRICNMQSTTTLHRLPPVANIRMQPWTSAAAAAVLLTRRSWGWCVYHEGHACVLQGSVWPPGLCRRSRDIFPPSGSGSRYMPSTFHAEAPAGIRRRTTSLELARTHSGLWWTVSPSYLVLSFTEKEKKVEIQSAIGSHKRSGSNV